MTGDLGRATGDRGHTAGRKDREADDATTQDGRWRPGRASREALVAGRAQDEARKRGRPRNRPLDENRRLILDAALEVFAAVGYHGASIEQVARRAGLQRRSVYEVFPDKGELFAAAVDDTVERVLDRIAHSFAEAEELELADSLRHNFRTALSIADTEPGWPALLAVSMLVPGDDPAAAAARAGRRRLEDAIGVSLTARWQELGLAAEHLAGPAAALIVGLAATMQLRQAHRPDLDRSEAADLLTHFTVGALAEVEAHLPRT